MNSDKAAIIKNVVDIILKHAKPERIYLYGSTATGEDVPRSDVDIAFDDAEFHDDYLIENEVEKIDTLLKIDVRNIAHAEERFRSRVRSTGKVLFSSSKKLRAEDGLYNFSRALERFGDALAVREKLARDGYGDVYLDLVVKRFEFTYEMAWKALMRFFDYMGIDAMYPRAIFKEAYARNLVEDEDVWLDMIEQRNLSSHIYNEWEIKGILAKVEAFHRAFCELKDNIEKQLK